MGYRTEEEMKMKKEIARRTLEEMPFDMIFGGDNCHATGDEVCFEGDDPKQPASWWNEYQDSEGNLWYGR